MGDKPEAKRNRSVYLALKVYRSVSLVNSNPYFCSLVCFWAKDPDELPKQLNFLIEGAIVCAYAGADEVAAERAKSMATIFLRQAFC